MGSDNGSRIFLFVDECLNVFKKKKKNRNIINLFWMGVSNLPNLKPREFSFPVWECRKQREYSEIFGHKPSTYFNKYKNDPFLIVKLSVSLREDKIKFSIKISSFFFYSREIFYKNVHKAFFKKKKKKNIKCPLKSTEVDLALYYC